MYTSYEYMQYTAVYYYMYIHTGTDPTAPKAKSSRLLYPGLAWNEYNGQENFKFKNIIYQIIAFHENDIKSYNIITTTTTTKCKNTTTPHVITAVGYVFFFFFLPPPFFFFEASGGGRAWITKVPPISNFDASSRSCTLSFISALLCRGAWERRAFSRFFQTVTERGARCPRQAVKLCQAFSKRNLASPRFARQKSAHASLFRAAAVSEDSAP